LISRVVSVEGHHSSPGGGLGEAQRGALGEADVSVVQQVDGGGGERLGQAESQRVQVAGDRDAAAFVGGVEDAV
jgi:hypothetical protein